ncbi:hypothetical protein D1871_17430 [Nakamurella silvestris]|nr:hypothetical protein D1871_17430 [Nakamurella silvestris]
MTTPPPDSQYPSAPYTPPGSGFPSPGPGYGGYPPPSRRRGRWLARFLVPAIVLAAGGGYYLYKKQTATENAAVGDCIQITSASLVNADTSQIDCNDPKAVYVVTATGGGILQCDEHESQVSLGDADTKAVDTRLCLRENVKAGDCWNEGATETDVPVKADCATVTDKAAFLKVLKVDLTTADPKKCPKGTDQSYSYPTRKAVICFAELT